MAHMELGHLMLDLSKTGQTGAFFHHLNQAFILQFGGYILPILHELSKPHILHSHQFTLWQIKE